MGVLRKYYDLKSEIRNSQFRTASDGVPELGGALAGKQKLLYFVTLNPAAGENCSHFSMLGHV